MNAELPPNVIFYDGVCHLCHGWVRRIARADKARRFRFAPLQGDTAAIARGAFAQFPTRLQTVVYIEDGAVHVRSRAVFYIAKRLGGAWRVLSWMRVLPAFLTDPCYRLVAWSRYRIFGRYERCQIPTETDRALMLP